MIYTFRIDLTLTNPKLHLNTGTLYRSFSLDVPPQGRATEYTNYIGCSDGTLMGAQYIFDLKEWHLLHIVKGLNRALLLDERCIRMEGMLLWVLVGKNRLFTFR